MPGLPPKVSATVLVAALALATMAWGGAKKPKPAGPGGDCASCHADAWPKKKVVHPPVQQGLCNACHRSSSATAHVFELAAPEGSAMCLQCHNARSSKKVLHPPVVEGLCLNCHDPHASDNVARLRLPVFETCTGCHPTQGRQDRTALTRHGALDPARNERVCVACHEPHQSDHERRLVDWPPSAVCLRCHDREVEADDRKLLDMKALLDANPEPAKRHGPVREGRCPECHEPHGTDHWRLLKGPFPGTQYAPYDGPETYGLCFRCHDARLAAEPVLKDKAVSNQDAEKDVSWGERPEGKRLLRGGTTGFRNGDENLHFRHVNKVDKGRPCRFCHDVHASPNAKHIRPTAPFGQWDFQLAFKKTMTGGSCWPGCHVERRYDREKRQENPR